MDTKQLPTGWLKPFVSIADAPLEPATLSEAPETPEASPAKHFADLPPLPHHSRRKLLIASALSLSAVVVAGWLVASVYLSHITVAGTTVSAHSSDAALAATLTARAKAYKLTIAYPDGAKKQYPLDKLGLSVNAKTSVAQTREKQQRLAQRLQWWKATPASIVLKTNTATLQGFIASEANVTAQPPKDAVLSIVNGAIHIDDAVAGKQYGLKQPEQTILTSARSLQSSTLTLKTVILNPPLTASLLEPYKARLEKAINQPVHFTIGAKTLTPTPSDIASWLEITPDDKTKKVDIAVNSGKVQEYIDDAAANYVYPAKAQIETTDASGATKVLVEGVNGVDVTDKSTAATSVSASLLDGKGMTVPLSVNYQSFQTITTGDYPKWIEVDLTTKRMYAYENASLVKTELVTAGAPSTPTVTGQYAIYSKFDQQDMRGNNVDGSKYYQPNVRWISYFYKDYAIHGNYWRPLSYFGNINSSHGCVSLVDTEAQWMYDWAPVGTPVIVHN